MAEETIRQRIKNSDSNSVKIKLLYIDFSK
jgi:hypothetical protein